MSLRILLADDEQAIRTVLVLHLQRRGWTVDAVQDGDEALACGREGGHDVLILDQRMPGLTGLEVARQLDVDVPVILYSAYLDAELQRQASELGCLTMRKADVDGLMAYLEGLAVE